MFLVKLVTIESPYAGEVERNLIYARRAMKDSLIRGESPIASHLLYTQVLDDNIKLERIRGINAGFDWAQKADKVVFYIDYGWSQGMLAARELLVNKLGKSWEVREIGKNIEDVVPTGT